MALNQGILVEMPPHCVRAKKNGAVYVQYTIRAYRNEKGKPTSERVSIGKEDPETGMLIPNRNYYEYVEKCKQMYRAMKQLKEKCLQHLLRSLSEPT